MPFRRDGASVSRAVAAQAKEHCDDHTAIVHAPRPRAAAVEHARLADAEEGERMKRCWRERLGGPAARLERGGLDV
jgi:hypothetical protein